MTSHTLDTSAPVLVTGATGDIGGSLLTALSDHAFPVRVMCRRPEQVRRFAAGGVDAVLGDFSDPGSLRRAMDGCEQLFLLSPDGTEQLTHDRRAIDAAVAAGMRHVVKVSTADANPQSAIPWARDHARADEYLRRSGLAWTRLQPAAYMKNLLTEAVVIRRGWLPQTAGHGATSWVDVADIAAVAAHVLTHPTAQGARGDDGRSYLLTGTPATSYPQIAEMLTDLLGHRVRYLQVPAPLFYLGLRAAGTPRWQARGLLHQFVDVVRRGHDDARLTSTAISDLLDRPPVSLADYIVLHRGELSRSPGPGTHHTTDRPSAA